MLNGESRVRNLADSFDKSAVLLCNDGLDERSKQIFCNGFEHLGNIENNCAALHIVAESVLFNRRTGGIIGGRAVIVLIDNICN